MIFAYIDPGTGFTVLSTSAWLAGFLFAFLGVFLLFFKKIFRFLKKHLIIAVIVVFLITLFAILTALGVVMNKRESRFDKKVFILGFDGLSPEIVESMMGRGELPNFYRIKDEGSYKRLSTTNPSQSPVAWAGFATGQNPGKNGIFDFIIRDPVTYSLNLSTSNIEKEKPKPVIKSKCFWGYLSLEKVNTVIITCPLTFPPYEVCGRMLSGMGVPDILGTEGTFSFYTTERLENSKNVGGKVFQIEKRSEMTMYLIGPRIAGPGGSADNAKVPFKVILQKEKESIFIEYQNNRFELKVGEWSDWEDVTFKLGFLRNAKGILKFYLVEINPEFKLYATPIDLDPRAPFFQISYPAGYSKDLADHIGLYHTRGMPMDTWAVNEKRLTEGPFLRQVNGVLKEKTTILDFELGRFKKGVLFCYFESPDVIQHMFWRYTDPEHPLYEKDASQEYKEAIESWYKKMDGILGSVMEKSGKEDIIIVLSDHGFGTFRRAAHINSWLRKNGYLELKDSHAASGAELLADIDWSKTKAYAIGFGAIYVNQRGREGKGIVAPGRETELLKEEISEKLKMWRDEKYNELIVRNVYPREEIFRGEYADLTPDLYIGFNKGYRASWQTALGGVPRELVEDNLKKWSGSHLFDPALVPGVIFSNKAITKKNPSIYDIAPTVLEIIGYDKKKLQKLNLDGKPLF